jgi:hypothetical protein
MAIAVGGSMFVCVLPALPAGDWPLVRDKNYYSADKIMYSGQ